jgi:hypothetical protein
MSAPLSRDAWLFLCEGLGDTGWERVPDGPRHHAAVRELTVRGFVRYGLAALEVTPAGRAHYETQREGAVA